MPKGIIRTNLVYKLCTAPVRCFHLTAPVLSGEKHLTSAKLLILFSLENVDITKK